MHPNDAEGKEEVRTVHLSLSDLIVEAVVRCSEVT